MNTTDPIADYLTRIRNAISARHKRVDVPSSRLKMQITKLLAEQNFISGYSEIKDNKQNIIRITLRYADGACAINGLKRVSTPGLRVYLPAANLQRVLNGMGIAVISTSRGVLTDGQAKAQKVGGEVLCHVW